MSATTVLACTAVIAWAAIAIGAMWWGQVGIAISVIREAWAEFRQDLRRMV